LETVTLEITGMSCAGCVRSVKQVLESVAAVRGAEVSLERAQAVCPSIRLAPAARRSRLRWPTRGTQRA
jgi:copper chaperone CopZ